MSSPAVSDPANYLDRLAAWAAATPLDAMPAAVRARGCMVIADSLGVTAHGMQTPEMREFVTRHPYGTFGTIGAAVALARLFGYDASAIRAIINVSATLGIAASAVSSRSTPADATSTVRSSASRS